MAHPSWCWTFACADASLRAVKLLRACGYLMLMSALAGCSCLPGSTLDQNGLSAPNVKPSRITAPDEVPPETKG